MNEHPDNHEILSLQSENRQLRDTINALRDALELRSIETEEAVQKAHAASNDEIVHLKATISALRDEMERIIIEHEHKMQTLIKSEYNEKEHLRGTIVQLRDHIEQTGKS